MNLNQMVHQAFQQNTSDHNTGNQLMVANGVLSNGTNMGIGAGIQGNGMVNTAPNRQNSSNNAFMNTNNAGQFQSILIIGNLVNDPMIIGFINMRTIISSPWSIIS